MAVRQCGLVSSRNNITGFARNQRAMAEEKQYHEEVTAGSDTTHDLTHEHNNRSHGLHHDLVAEEALGGRTADLGKSYFTSINFIGTVIVCCNAIFSDESS